MAPARAGWLAGWLAHGLAGWLTSWLHVRVRIPGSDLVLVSPGARWLPRGWLASGPAIIITFFRLLLCHGSQKHKVLQAFQ